MKLFGHSKWLGLCVDNLDVVAQTCGTNPRSFGGGGLTPCNSPLCCGQAAVQLWGLKTARPRGLSTYSHPPTLSESQRQSSHPVYTWASRFTAVHPLISSWCNTVEETMVLQCSDQRKNSTSYIICQSVSVYYQPSQAFAFLVGWYATEPTKPWALARL